MVKKQKLGSMFATTLMLLGMVFGATLQTMSVHAATNAEDCVREGGMWKGASGCLKPVRKSVSVSRDICDHLHGTVSADGNCNYYVYEYAWGGAAATSGGSEGATSARVDGNTPADVTRECEEMGGHIGPGGIKAVAAGVYEGDCVIDGVEGGEAGGNWYDPSLAGDGYSRPEHPGREPTENENNDPGESETKVDAGIEAVPGNGYSSTGGVKTDPEKLETAVLDCDGDDAIFCVLNTALTVLTWGVGIAATVGIVLSGIQYTSSRDNAEQTAKAIKRIIGIVIGLLVYAMMWGFLNWLIPGGLF